jgi:subtilisin family serine protease
LIELSNYFLDCNIYMGECLYVKFAGRIAALFALVSILSLASAAQQTTPPSNPEPAAQSVPSPTKDQSNSASKPGDAPGSVDATKQQPQRILGIMPNFRAVSAGATPPPPTPKQAFVIATKNSFDYSSFVFVGITSALAEWSDAHPSLGDGMAGYGRYYWRGFLDKTDGNYMVIFALPTVLHQDGRYYAMGTGNFFKRGVYASSRILITRDYHGHNTFNASEIFGRAIAQGISTTYYPSHDRTIGALAVKFGWAMGRDALTNTFREFWPDIATHVLHRQP